MRTHFSIGYPRGFEQVFNWLQRRAAEDPKIAYREEDNGQFYLVIADSDDSAKWLQEQLDANRSLPIGPCVIEVSPEFSTMSVNLECGDDETAVTATLIKDLLSQFPEYRIYDEDSGDEITDLVRVDVNELFKSDTQAPAASGE
jgi:hypothetical protein